ncbi:MAG: hypothetical protein CVT66_01320 [Actinobacteria bacterium HGW-Actinobacteria-6]|nr:MAG: hypothetical protein CVT66_01320 [Actinobacteria bacterium HGW-Actinobacteria-6]
MPSAVPTSSDRAPDDEPIRRSMSAGGMKVSKSPTRPNTAMNVGSIPVNDLEPPARALLARPGDRRQKNA